MQKEPFLNPLSESLILEQRAHLDKAVYTVEERDKLLKFFALQISNFLKLHKMRDAVTLTSIIIYRKFFLKASVLEYDPRTVAFTSIIIALKICELAHLTSVVQVFGPISSKIPLKDILDLELVVLGGIDFKLQIATPLRSLLGIRHHYLRFVEFQSLELVEIRKSVASVMKQANESFIKLSVADYTLLSEYQGFIAMAVFEYEGSKVSLPKLDEFLSEFVTNNYAVDNVSSRKRSIQKVLLSFNESIQTLNVSIKKLIGRRKTAPP